MTSRFGWWSRAQPPERVNLHASRTYGHRLNVALPHVLVGIGMSGGLDNPSVGARNKNTIEESHEETELSSNMN